MKMILFYTTFETLEQAEKFARLILDADLCVCTNILPSFSMFKDDGKIIARNESVMLIKTIPEKRLKIEKFVEKNHPFSCPCLLEIDASSLIQPFNAWVVENLG